MNQMSKHPTVTARHGTDEHQKKKCPHNKKMKHLKGKYTFSECMHNLFAYQPQLNTYRVPVAVAHCNAYIQRLWIVFPCFHLSSP